MIYPTKQQIEDADQIRLAKWYRFLPIAQSDDEVEKINLIAEKLGEKGGMTPQISKQIGWTCNE